MYMYWTKRVTHIFTGLTFCITQQWGAGKLPTSQEARLIFSLLSLPLHLTISELPDMDYVTYMKLARNGTFSLVGFNLTTQLNVCNHLLVGHCRNPIPTKNCLLWPDDRIEVPSWTDSSVLQGSTGWRFNAFPFSNCLTQDFPGSNAVHTLPWPAYLPSCTPPSIGEGPHWLPDTVTWPTPTKHVDEIPQARIAHLIPSIHATEMLSSAWGTRSATTIIDLAALNGLLHRANAAINFCLENDYSRKFSDLTHTKQFRWTVFILIKLSVEIDVLFFVQCSSIEQIIYFSQRHPNHNQLMAHLTSVKMLKGLPLYFKEYCLISREYFSHCLYEYHWLSFY